MTDLPHIAERPDAIGMARICLGISATAAFFASCVWYDFLKFYAHFDFNRVAVFACALVAGGAYAAFRRDAIGDRRLLAIPIYFALMAVLHLAMGLPLEPKHLSMYTAPVAAFVFLFLDRRLIVWPMIATLIVSTLIQVQEFYSFSYWYAWSDAHITHNVELYMANQGLFRAKGLFAGPLNGYDFGLLALLFTEFSYLVIACVGLGAVLAASKSGIVASLLAILLRCYNSKRLLASLATTGVIAVAYLGSAQVIRSHVGIAKAGTKQIAVAKQDIAEYVGRAVDLNVNSTADRIASWDRGFQEFARFSPFHMIFGDPNFTYRVPALEDRGLESSIQKELQDYGIVGFLIALAIKLAVCLKLWRSNIKMAIGFAGYCALAAVSPIFTPLGFNVLFWLFMLQTLASHPNGYTPSLHFR